MWLFTHVEIKVNPLHWRHNARDVVSNHQPHDCLLNRLFRRRSQKILKLRVSGLCEGNSPVTGEFPAQMASNAETVSIWWRHHAMLVKGFIANYSTCSYLPTRFVLCYVLLCVGPDCCYLLPHFNGLGKDKCKTRRERFKFRELVRPILDVLR